MWTWGVLNAGQEFCKDFPRAMQIGLCHWRSSICTNSVDFVLTGNPVLPTPKALEILVVLVQNGNRLTTKEELMRKVWPDSFVEEANLTVNISAPRKQLGDAPNGQQYIEA